MTRRGTALRCYFNPRPRAGGATVDERGESDDESISILAPVRGATDAHRFSETHLQISIHAPVRGATPSSLPEYESP